MANSTISAYGKGWDGILYPAGSRKDKVMIVMSGSDGGLEHAGKMAHFLQDNGIPALAFGYFKTKHSCKFLDRVPVETVAGAMRWLKRLGYEKIGIVGASKGAELALAAAIAYPELSCVIVKIPSWFYSEGLINGQPSGSSCWTFDGRELPYSPYKMRKFHMVKQLWQAKEFNILPMNEGKKIVEASIIPIEKVKAPVLMLSTKADTIWPSAESCEKLTERLRTNNFAYPYRHVCYEHISHMMLEYCGSEIKYFMKSERLYPEACAAERRAMGQECLDWINHVWNI